MIAVVSKCGEWLFKAQVIEKPDADYDVPRILFPFWWCMYHTIGRVERWIEQNSQR